MTKFQFSRRWLLAILLALGLAIPVIGLAGKGGGKPGGGGTTDPPPNDPGVRFTPHYFSIPGLNGRLLDANNQGQVVGYFDDENNNKKGFFYDLLWDTGEAVDLNSITIGIPDGHRIVKATGINETGQISVYLEDDTLDGLQADAGMVDLNYKDAEGKTVPKLYLVPNPNNLNFYASDINDQGDLLLLENDGADPVPCWIYNFGMAEPDFAMAEPVPLPVVSGSDTRFSFINNRTADRGPQIVGGRYRYTVGDSNETFPDYVDSDGNTVSLGYPLGLNNLGEFCGGATIFYAQKVKGKDVVSYAAYVQGETTEMIDTATLRDPATAINDSSDVLLASGVMYHGQAGTFRITDWLNASDTEIAAFQQNFNFGRISDRVFSDTDIPMVTAIGDLGGAQVGAILIPQIAL